MDGFYNGVMNYNAVHEADVKVLGWDPATQEGLFTGNFESTDDGRALGETLMDEGADIIMPVAGPVGLGTAAAAQERGDVYIVGVDNDWTQTSPEYADLILTSVLKNMDVSVYLATEAILDGSFAGGLQFNNLANGGVGVAPFLPGMISSDVQAELDQVAADLIAGAEMAMPEMMEPFGTEENPLVWVLVPSQDTEAVLTGAEEIAAVIEDRPASSSSRSSRPTSRQPSKPCATAKPRSAPSTPSTTFWLPPAAVLRSGSPRSALARPSTAAN
jgi:hypothetical protein